MRATSEVNDVNFPFADDRVPFVLIFPEGGGKEGRGFEHASHYDKKRELVAQAKGYQEGGQEVQLLAIWPGAKRSDVFLVDDLDEALAAFG